MEVAVTGPLSHLCTHARIPRNLQDCVQKTITRMEGKFTDRVLAHVVFMLRSSDRVVQQRAAMALARRGETTLAEVNRVTLNA